MQREDIIHEYKIFSQAKDVLLKGTADLVSRVLTSKAQYHFCHIHLFYTEMTVS